MERRRDDDEGPESPKPSDAPVETPEADPRTKDAPDGEAPRSVEGPGPRSVDDEPDDTTERQIQEAFEEGGGAREP